MPRPHRRSRLRDDGQDLRFVVIGDTISDGNRTFRDVSRRDRGPRAATVVHRPPGGPGRLARRRLLRHLPEDHPGSALPDPPHRREPRRPGGRRAHLAGLLRRRGFLLRPRRHALRLHEQCPRGRIFRLQPGAAGLARRRAERARPGPQILLRPRSAADALPEDQSRIGLPVHPASRERDGVPRHPGPPPRCPGRLRSPAHPRVQGPQTASSWSSRAAGARGISWSPP